MKRDPYKLVDYQDGVLLVGPGGERIASAPDPALPCHSVWFPLVCEWMNDADRRAYAAGRKAERRKKK